MISVIIPTYNRANTICRAIDSVLNQTYRDIEIIVIDDFSTDNTEFVLSDYINTKKIKYYKLLENKGACFARNYGVKLSKGDYIAFQDSDDWWLPNKLEIQLNYITKTKADMVFSAFTKIDEETGKINKKFPDNLVKDCFVSYNDLLVKSLISTQVMMIKKSCFNDIIFDETMPRFQDWDFSLRFSNKYRIFYINQILCKVYFQRNSISKNPKNGIQALEKIYKKNESNYLKNKVAFSNLIIFYGILKKRNKEKYFSYYITALKQKVSLYNILRIIKNLI